MRRRGLPFLSGRRRASAKLLAGVPGLRAWYSARDPRYFAHGYEQALPVLFDSVNGWHATQSTANNQARYIPWWYRNYLRAPGVTGNYASTPSPDSGPDSTLDIVACIAPASWASDMPIIAQGATSGTRKFQFRLLTSANSRRMRISLYPNGTDGMACDLDADLPFTAGPGWVRCTRDSATGFVTFYCSTDSETTKAEDVAWTQIGSVVSGTTSALFNSANTVRVGMQDISQTYFTGRIIFVGMRSTIGGPFVLSFDPSLANGNSASIVAATGETWTINRTGGNPAMIVSAPQFLPLVDDRYEMPSASFGMFRNVPGATIVRCGACTNFAAESYAFVMAVSAASPGLSKAQSTVLATPAYGAGGRRVGTDSFQAVAVGTPVLYGHSIHIARLDYANALAANFVNGALIGSESAFQTAGLAEDTLSGQGRVFSSVDNTPSRFWNGPVSDILVYDRALTNAEQLRLAQYLAAATGGAISV